MKFPLPDDFFPIVHLAQEEEERFLNLKDYVLQTHIDAYDEHAFIDRGAIDARQWKYLKKMGDLTAYRRRGRVKKKLFFSSSSSSSSHATSSSCVSTTFTPNLPSILIVGTITGTLEDVMYGCMASTKEDRTLRAKYTQDGVVDSSVLYTFEKPTQQDPFKSTAIKWSLKKTPGSTIIVKNRDFCFIGATGIAKCSNDELIGYELRHSVEFPSCPPLQEKSVVRGQLYICSIYRQIQPGVVEMYYKATYDGRGELLDLIASYTVVDTLLGAATRAIECAYAKKLMRALKKSLILIENNGNQNLKKGYHEVKIDCAMCNQKMGRIKNEDKKCPLCQQYVCSACAIRKRLMLRMASSTSTTGKSSINSRNDYQEVHFLESSYLSNSGSYIASTSTTTITTKETTTFHFCKACFVQVRNENAAHVAREEIMERLEFEKAQAALQQEKDQANAEMSSIWMELLESSRTIDSKSRSSRRRSRTRTLETKSQTMDPRLLLAGFDSATLSMASNSSSARSRTSSGSAIIGTLSTQSTPPMLHNMSTTSINTYPKNIGTVSNTNSLLSSSSGIDIDDCSNSHPYTSTKSNSNSTSSNSQRLFRSTTAGTDTGTGTGNSNTTSDGLSGGGFSSLDDTHVGSVSRTGSIYGTPASSVPAPISLMASVPETTPSTNDLIPLVTDRSTLIQSSNVSLRVAVEQSTSSPWTLDQSEGAEKEEEMELIEPLREPIEEEAGHPLVSKLQELCEKVENTYLLARSQSSLHGPFNSYLARS